MFNKNLLLMFPGKILHQVHIITPSFPPTNLVSPLAEKGGGKLCETSDLRKVLPTRAYFKHYLFLILQHF